MLNLSPSLGSFIAGFNLCNLRWTAYTANKCVEIYIYAFEYMNFQNIIIIIMDINHMQLSEYNIFLCATKILTQIWALGIKIISIQHKCDRIKISKKLNLC